MASRWEPVDGSQPDVSFVGKATAACRFRDESLLDLSWAADGRSLAMAGLGGPVRIWDLGSGRVRPLVEGPGGETGSTGGGVASYSPDGESLAVGTTEGEVAIWDIKTGRKRARLEVVAEPIRSIAWMPDGRGLAWSTGCSIRGCKLDSGRVEVLADRDGPYLKLTSSSDGRWLAASGGDGLVRVWDRTTGRVRLQIRSHSCGVGGLAFTADGRSVIACSASGPSRVWDVVSGEERSLPGEAFGASAIACSPDGGRLAASARDGTIRVRDLSSGREVVRISGHSGTVAAIAWSPDGRTLASSSFDGAARLWDVSGIP